MNILSLVLYMVIGGVMYGLAHNSKAEECGQPRPLAEDMAPAIVIWPALIAAALVIDDKNFAPISTCKTGEARR